MRLTILAVGDKLPSWAEEATAEYLKRMPREARVELAVVKPEKRGSQSAQTLKQAEAVRLLDKLPAEPRPRVFFVTAYDRYAVRAFELRAVDYVLKPYDDDRLLAAVGRAKESLAGRAPEVGDLLELLRRLGQSAPSPIAVRTRRGIVLVPVEEIDWIEAEDNYVRLHVGPKSHLLRSTLADMESRLPPQRFLRVHRGAIVNVDRMRELQPSTHGDFKILLRDGATVPMSRRFRSQVQERLGVDL